MAEWGSALSWTYADAAFVVAVAVRVRRRRGPMTAAGLAAAATTCGDAAIRRAVTELEPRPSRRRPGRHAGAAGVCGRRGHRGVRRGAGRPAAGVGRPPRAACAPAMSRCGRRCGPGSWWPRARCSASWWRPCRLPGAGLSALGRDVGARGPRRLRRPAGAVGVDADPAQAPARLSRLRLPAICDARDVATVGIMRPPKLIVPSAAVRPHTALPRTARSPGFARAVEQAGFEC